MEAKAPVRIYSPTFKLLNEIDIYDSFIFTESYHGIGSFEWKLPAQAVKSVKELKEGNHVLFLADNQLFGYIDYFSTEKNEEGQEFYVVKGFPNKGFSKERITVPASNQDTNKAKGTPDQQMIQYLNDYLVNTINPLDAVPLITLKPAAGIGPVSTYETRNKILSDEIETISSVSGIGWRGYIDFQIMKYVIETFQGVNRTRNQRENVPLIFSYEYDNVKELEYTRSNLEYKNVGIVAGEGEGSDRTIVTIGDINAAGTERRVTFIDARDIQTEEDEENPADPEETRKVLEQRGIEKMADMKKIETLTVTPSDIVSFGDYVMQYRKDYDLGDIVTCEDKRLNAYVDDRITKAEHSIDSNGTYSLVFTIGYEEPSLVKKIKKEIAKGQATGETVANSEIKGGSELARKAIATAGTAEKTAQQAAVDAQEAKQANEDAKAIALRAETTASAALNSAALSNETSNRALLTAQNKDRLRALFVASEGQTVVPLPFEYTPGKYQLDVYLDKLHCISGTPPAGLPTGLAADYIENDKETITFTTPLKGGSIVEVILPE